MAKVTIKNIDDLEQNFELFVKAQIDVKYQNTIDILVKDFVELFKEQNDFVKKHYPKLAGYFIDILKEKSNFENINTIKLHIESIAEYIESANKIPSTKMQTLQRLLAEYELMYKADSFNEIVNDYLQTNKHNITYCIELIKNEMQTTNQPTPPQTEIEPIDSTLHQQFLIFHYLFKHLEISPNTIDKTEIARFIQFATQKQLEAKKIQNTSIYKLVDNPFNGYKKEKGITQKNLQKVRELFESIGLKEIAEIVSKDII